MTATRAHIGVGSNLADPARQIEAAFSELAALPTRGWRPSHRFIAPRLSVAARTSPIISTQSPRSTQRSRRDNCSPRCRRSNAVIAGVAPSSMRRERSISICYYTARISARAASFCCRIRACTFVDLC